MGDVGVQGLPAELHITQPHCAVRALDSGEDQSGVHQMLGHAAGRCNRHPGEATPHQVRTASRDRADEPVEDECGSQVAEAECRRAEHPAVQRGTANPPLRQNKADDRAEGCVDHWQQDRDWQFPDRVHIPNRPSALPCPSDQLQASCVTRQQQSEQHQVVDPHGGMRSGDHNHGRVGNGNSGDEGNQPPRQLPDGPGSQGSDGLLSREAETRNGTHARPPAGRVRSARVLTEVVASARAIRTRSAPSAVRR